MDELMLKELTAGSFTPANWLTYYKNIWVKNLVARTIDLNQDRMLQEKKPDAKVLLDRNPGMTPPDVVSVAERIEYRKMLCQDALNILESVTVLEEVPAAEFAQKMWSEEALKAVKPEEKKAEGEPAKPGEVKDTAAVAPAEEKKEEGASAEAKV